MKQILFAKGSKGGVLISQCGSCLCTGTHIISGARMCGLCGRVIDKQVKAGIIHWDCPLGDAEE